MTHIVGIFHGSVIEDVTAYGLSQAAFLLATAALFLLFLLTLATASIAGRRVLAIALFLLFPTMLKIINYSSLVY